MFGIPEDLIIEVNDFLVNDRKYNLDFNRNVDLALNDQDEYVITNRKLVVITIQWKDYVQLNKDILKIRKRLYQYPKFDFLVSAIIVIGIMIIILSVILNK